MSAAYFFFPGRRSPVEEEEGKSIKRLFRLPGIYREVQRHIYLFITNTSSLFFFFLLYFYLLLLFFLLCFIFRLVVIIRSLEKIEKTKTFFGATFESRKRAYHRNLIFTVYLYIYSQPVTFTIPHGRHVPLHGWFFGRTECSSDNVVVMAVVVAAWFVAMTNDE